MIGSSAHFFDFMARITQREVLQDRQDVSQPALFDDAGFPALLPVLEAVRAKSYEHQGKRLTEDDTKALRLVECLVMNWGVKKIAREMHISPHTVRAAKRLLVTQGKLAPYKQRVVQLMEDVIETGLTNYRDGLENGSISAAQIPVGMGIIFDKRQVSLGEATTISGSVGDGAEGIRVEDLNRYIEELPSCKSDSQSTGNPAEPPQTGIVGSVDVTLDVSTPPPSPVVETTDQANGAGDPAATGGGGGRAPVG